MKHHLAQANVAYAKGNTDDPMMKGFHERIDPINTLAEQSPGFVWRYVTDSRDPLDRVFEDPLILFNFSVWESIEALHHFTYKTVHAELYSGRRQWFADWKTQAGAVMGIGLFAMWWIRAGQLPTVEEARQKLRLIAERGPTPLAFHFKTRFSAEQSEAWQALGEPDPSSGPPTSIP
jgi:hypothetical protein